MTIMPFDAIRRAMDAQLSDFCARRAAAERDDKQRCDEFGDVVDLPGAAAYEIAAGEAFEQSPFEQQAFAQQPFLRPASEPIPDVSSRRRDLPALRDVSPVRGINTDSSDRADTDYREAPWLRRASD